MSPGERVDRWLRIHADAERVVAPFLGQIMTPERMAAFGRAIQALHDRWDLDQLTTRLYEFRTGGPGEPGSI
jgi:hypothetical protein